MNVKFQEKFTAAVKDFGLSKKAVEELLNLGSADLADDASDDDVTAKVDSLVPFAKAMQGEITRKTRKSNQPKSSKEEGKGEGEEDDSNEMPAWAKAFNEKLDKLTEENAALKAEKLKSERTAQIAAKAKELGIPEYLMKRVSISDDADFEKELTDFKQELVSNNLVPKSASHEPGKVEEGYKADAKSWAESLPDR